MVFVLAALIRGRGRGLICGFSVLFSEDCNHVLRCGLFLSFPISDCLLRVRSWRVESVSGLPTRDTSSLMQAGVAIELMCSAQLSQTGERRCR